eukprot:Skav233960  [mRNA]  locus=scaffold1382:298134:302420:+ [translate_table: standard]
MLQHTVCRTASALRQWAAVSTLPKDGLTLADFMPSPPAAAKRPQPMRKPKWLKMVNPNLTPEGTERYKDVRATIKETGLATVCQEARCPNAGECWSGGTATVMIMGDTCTRGCRFCSVATSRSPPPPDAEEPRKATDAFCRQPDLKVETLIGDFQGKLDLVEEARRAPRCQRCFCEGFEKPCQARPDVVTKSSIMLGLGETDEEIQQA